MHARFAIYLLAFALAATAIHPQAQYAHSGKVVDAPTGKPLANVTASAYSSNERRDAGACPKYIGFIGDALSGNDGTFTLRVPQASASYLVTYCNTRYVTFTHDGNSNVQDGSAIDPLPVRLFPRVSDLSDMSHAMRVLRDDSRVAVSILHDANIKAFMDALASLPPSDQALVRAFVEHQIVGATQSADSLTLQRLTRGVRHSLEYFRGANASAFDLSIPEYPELRQYALDTQILPPLQGDMTQASKQFSAAYRYQVWFREERVSSDDTGVFVTGTKMRVTGGISLDYGSSISRAPTTVSGEQLKARNNLVVAIVCEVGKDCEVRPAIEVDSKGSFAAEIDLGEPIRGHVRLLEFSVIVATPEVFEHTPRTLLNTHGSLCPLLQTVSVHQSSADDN